MPTSSFQNLDATSDSGTTPRAANGLPSTTPGFPIGMASPVATSSDEAQHTDGQGEAAEGEDSARTPSQLPPTPGRSSGYFMSKSQAGDSEDTKPAVTPAPAPEPPASSTPASPTVEDKEEKKKSGIFGKKFNLSKTLGRKSADVKQLTSAPATDENKSEVASDKSSEKDTEPQVIEDNFYGVVQRIRHDYKEQSTANPDHPLNMGIAPSLPIETPVLKPPPHTLVIIQEDDPDSGGVADSYRGEIGNLGREADILEKIAPMWLGDLLLKVSNTHSPLPTVLSANTLLTHHFNRTKFQSKNPQKYPSSFTHIQTPTHLSLPSPHPTATPVSTQTACSAPRRSWPTSQSESTPLYRIHIQLAPITLVADRHSPNNSNNNGPPRQHKPEPPVLLGLPALLLLPPHTLPQLHSHNHHLLPHNRILYNNVPPSQKTTSNSSARTNPSLRT